MDGLSLFKYLAPISIPIEPCGFNSISFPPKSDSKKFEFMYRLGSKFLFSSSLFGSCKIDTCSLK